jgi:hypothetical protein
LKKIAHAKNTGNEKPTTAKQQNESDTTLALLSLASKLKSPDEAGADLLAVYALKLSAEDVQDMRDLLIAIESSSDPRTMVIEAISDYLQDHRSVKPILLAQSMNANRTCDEKRSSEFNESWSGAQASSSKNLRDALGNYIAYQTPGRIIQIQGIENYKPMPFAEIVNDAGRMLKQHGCAYFHWELDNGAWFNIWTHNIDNIN